MYIHLWSFMQIREITLHVWHSQDKIRGPSNNQMWQGVLSTKIIKYLSNCSSIYLSIHPSIHLPFFLWIQYDIILYIYKLYTHHTRMYITYCERNYFRRLCGFMSFGSNICTAQWHSVPALVWAHRAHRLKRFAEVMLKAARKEVERSTRSAEAKMDIQCVLVLVFETCFIIFIIFLVVGYNMFQWAVHWSSLNLPPVFCPKSVSRWQPRCARHRSWLNWDTLMVRPGCLCLFGGK